MLFLCDFWNIVPWILRTTLYILAKVFRPHIKPLDYYRGPLITRRFKHEIFEVCVLVWYYVVDFRIYTIGSKSLHHFYSSTTYCPNNERYEVKHLTFHTVSRWRWCIHCLHWLRMRRCSRCACRFSALWWMPCEAVTMAALPCLIVVCCLFTFCSFSRCHGYLGTCLLYTSPSPRD